MKNLINENIAERERNYVVAWNTLAVICENNGEISRSSDIAYEGIVIFESKGDADKFLKGLSKHFNTAKFKKMKVRMVGELFSYAYLVQEDGKAPRLGYFLKSQIKPENNLYANDYEAKNAQYIQPKKSSGKGISYEKVFDFISTRATAEQLEAIVFECNRVMDELK